MSLMRSLRFEGYGPVWGLAGSMVVLVALILVWGIDWSGPDTTPPAPIAASASRSVSWSGGVCVDLELWNGSHWDRIGSAGHEDATAGVWGPPTRGERFCNPVAVFDDQFLLPADAVAGNYRLCNSSGEPSCVAIAYEPE